MEYWVGNTKLEYVVEGPVSKGDDIILLNQADDLTKLTTWSDKGYSIESLFDNDTFISFERNVSALLTKLWRQSGFDTPENFELSQYHEVARSRELHLRAIEFTKLLSIAEFPVPIKILENRISELLKCKVIARNPWDNQSVFHFRIIRPNSKDNNPLHRDVWLPDYSDCINLYIPIAGSNENSSLIIAPGSHRWPESNLEKTVTGAVINGVQFNVPAVSKIFTPVTFDRPNPLKNEVLIFSPYLIHGGSINLNPDQTRISIEIRLWRK